MTFDKYGLHRNKDGEIDAVAHIWNAQDVRDAFESKGIDFYPTDSDCGSILETALESVDCEYGFSWGTLSAAIDYFCEMHSIKND